MTGSVVIDQDGNRRAMYLFSMYINKNGLLKSFLKFEITTKNYVNFSKKN